MEKKCRSTLLVLLRSALTLLVILWVLNFSAKAAATEAQEEILCQNQDLIQACDVEGHINVETAYGDLVADAFRWRGAADIAFVPCADLGNHLQPGDVTRSDVANTLLNDRMTAVAELSAQQIYDYLETSISYIVMNEDATINWAQSYSDGYLQVSGIQVKFDTAAPIGERIMKLTLTDGTPLERDDSQTMYRVASTEELLTGGFGYQPVEVLETMETEVDVVSAYLAQLGTVGIPEDTDRTKLLGTREFFSGYGRMIGALIGVVGLILVITITRVRKRRKQREQERQAEARQYEIDQ